MFKQQYKAALAGVNPGEDLVRQTLKGLRPRRAQRAYRFAALAAGLALIALATPLLRGGSPGAPAPDGVPALSAAPLTVEPGATATPQPAAETGVRYSDLRFPGGTAVEIPAAPDGAALCIAPFTEEMIGDSDLVIKATVQSVRIKDYGEEGEYLGDNRYAVYSLRVDRVYFDRVGVAEGETFVIEEYLYVGSSLWDLVMQLQAGRQYILPIRFETEQVTLYRPGQREPLLRARESPYSLIYPFAPQIQVTADNAYLFFESREEGTGWRSLGTAAAIPVTMDVELQGDMALYRERMYLRRDEAFERDFQRLVDRYCGKPTPEAGE